MRTAAAIALAIIGVLTSIGCESDAQTRAKYDAWFPPNATREEIIKQYGEPSWGVERPTTPTEEQWEVAVKDKVRLLKPWYFAKWAVIVESDSGRRVERFDTFSPPSHWNFWERIDLLGGGHVDIVFFDPEMRVITSYEVPSSVWMD